LRGDHDELAVRVGTPAVRRRWQRAIASALRLCDVVVALALVVALVDLRWVLGTARRATRPPGPPPDWNVGPFGPGQRGRSGRHMNP